jgi:inosine/xanthosine triphosphatase
MKVGMGSKNQTKVAALRDVLKEYPIFSGCEVIGKDVVVEEFGHPKNITETVEGAILRAKQAYEGNDYGFGIEGGLMAVPHTKSGVVEVAACAIFDGSQVHLGLSPAFEWPTKVTDSILNKGLDGSQAMKEAGLTPHEKIGEKEGVIGLLTKGRMNRTEYNKLAIMMALTHLENPEHF